MAVEDHNLTDSTPLVDTVDIQDDEPVEIQGSRKRKRVSDVWDHFEKILAQGKVVAAKCNYCHKILSAKNGTRSLRYHAQTCVRRTYKDIRQAILSGDQKNGDNINCLNSSHFDQEASRKDLATMVIVHEYALSIVDHPLFRKFVKGLQPLFKIPARNTLKRDILRIYECERNKTLKILENNSSRISLTTDMWTASNQKKGFMAVTAHYIDNNWNLQSILLRFIYVPCPHTGEVLAEELISCMFESNIDRKLSALTVDNCSTNDVVIRTVLEKLDTSSLMLGGALFHMRCSAHILNLIVQDGLARIGKGLEKVRNSVLFWTASPKRLQTFKENARQVSNQCSKMLSPDCVTRWNSTYDMLSVALEYKNVFFRLKTRDALYTCYPDENEWDIAKRVCERLKVFSKVTELFSGSQYPTANLFFPLICEVKASLFEWQSSSDAIIRELAKNMFPKFDKYWAIIHGGMGVACVLDPRYKLKLLQYLFSKLYGEENAYFEVDRIRKMCEDLLYEYQKTFDASKRDQPVSELLPSSNTKWNGNIDLLNDYDSFVCGADDVVVKSELDLYLEERVLPRSNDFDILGYWKNVGSKYPMLQKIARDIFAIPVSTVASESAFSTGGRLVSPHRNRLSPETLEALMCAQCWLRRELSGDSSKKNDSYSSTMDHDCDSDKENN